MARRKTNEEFLKECEEKGVLNKIKILKPYEKNSVKLPCLCLKHNKVYEQLPPQILKTLNGCPICRGEHVTERLLKDHNYFLQKCKTAGVPDFYEFLGEYKSASTEIPVYCHKHNIQWNCTPNNIYYHPFDCPECMKETIKLGIDKKKIPLKEFLSRFKKNNQNFNNIEILDIENYDGINSYAKCKCKICNYEWKVKYEGLTHGSGCPICANRNRGLNQRKTNEEFDEELHNKFPFIDRIENYNGYYEKIKFYCNDCNNYFYSSPASVYRMVGCPMCGDGISFPNKMSRNIISAFIPIKNYNIEWMPEWAKPLRYDVYFVLNNKEYILEADGGLHKKPRNKSKKARQELKQRQESDAIKDELAKNHNIEMIRIDCENSRIEKVVDSFKNNKKLNELFDLKNFDWDLCVQKSLRSLTKDVCEYYNANKNKLSLEELGIPFKISRDTVRNYLKIGTKLGLCDYKPNYSIKRYKSVYVFDLNNNFLQKFDSLKECENYYNENGVNLNNAGMTGVLKGRTNKTKGFIFRYENDIIFEDNLIKPLSREDVYNKYN